MNKINSLIKNTMSKFFKKKYVSVISISLIALVIGFVVQFVRAGYVGPTSVAPNSNIGAPINTGNVNQEKSGSITANTFNSSGFADLGWVNGSKTPRCLCDLNEMMQDCSSTVGLASFGNNNTCYDQFELLNINLSNKYVKGETSISADGIQFSDGSLQTTAVEKDVPDSVCYGVSSGQMCNDGYYLKATDKCCPFSSNVAASVGTWYEIEEMAIDHSQSVDNGWATLQTKSFVAPKKITAMKISGSTYRDGGYCYAYWGSGSLWSATYPTGGQSGLLNTNNQNYPKTGTILSTTEVDCSSQNVDYSDGYTCYDVACPSGQYYSGPSTTFEGDAGYGYSSEPSCMIPCPVSVDNNGNISICQTPGTFSFNPTLNTLTKTKTGLNIAEGTTVNFQGRQVDGGGYASRVTCKFEVQYAN